MSSIPGPIILPPQPAALRVPEVATSPVVKTRCAEIASMPFSALLYHVLFSDSPIPA